MLIGPGCSAQIFLSLVPFWASPKEVISVSRNCKLCHKLLAYPWAHCPILIRGIRIIGGSQVAQWIKNLPAVLETQETWVQSLGWEDPLEMGIATHSSILAWRIPMDRKARQATVHRGAKSWT